MSILVNQLKKIAHDYVRRGAKANRRQQLGRMIKFLEFVEESERPNNLHEIGKRHVVSFWKAHRSMAAKTRYGYWLALSELWRLTKKPGTPPKPFIFESTPSNQPQIISVPQKHWSKMVGVLPTLIEISQLLYEYRKSHSLSLDELSDLTDLPQLTIQSIETGDSQCYYTDILKLYDFFKSNIEE